MFEPFWPNLKGCKQNMAPPHSRLILFRSFLFCDFGGQLNLTAKLEQVRRRMTLRLVVFSLFCAMLRPSTGFGVSRAAWLHAPGAQRAVLPARQAPSSRAWRPPALALSMKGPAAAMTSYTEEKVADIVAQLRADDLKTGAAVGSHSQRPRPQRCICRLSDSVRARDGHALPSRPSKLCFPPGCEGLRRGEVAPVRNL